MTASIDERRQALRDRFPVWTPRTLDGWLDECAGRYGDRPFVITDDVTLTYAQVAALSRRLADGLVGLGVRPGDRVGMLMANYPEFVPLKFAIARTGAVAIPFNYLYQANELGYVLAQSECNVLITMTGFMNLDYPTMLDSIVPGWGQPGFADREPGSGGSDTLRHVVLFETGSAPREGALDL